MSLYNGIDPTGIASLGVYTKTYGVGEEGNVANLYVSLGYFEDAPRGVEGGWFGFIHKFWEYF